MLVRVFFGFDVTAGKGFGSIGAGTYDCHSNFSDVMTQENRLNYRIGVWIALKELESLNNKEFYNLVETTEACETEISVTAI